VVSSRGALRDLYPLKGGPLFLEKHSKGVLLKNLSFLKEEAGILERVLPPDPKGRKGQEPLENKKGKGGGADPGANLPSRGDNQVAEVALGRKDLSFRAQWEGKDHRKKERRICD